MGRVLVVSLLVLVATLTTQHSDTTTVADDMNYKTEAEFSEVVSEDSNHDGLDEESTAKPTYLGELFVSRFGKSIFEWQIRKFSEYKDTWQYINSFSDVKTLKNDTFEIFFYLNRMNLKSMIQFSRYLARVPLQTIYGVLNGYCAEYPEPRIQDLREEPIDTECVKTQLVKWLHSKLKPFIAASPKKEFDECVERHRSMCSTENLKCTLAFGERVAPLLINFTADLYDVISLVGVTPLDILTEWLDRTTQHLSLTFSSPFIVLPFMTYYLITTPAINEYPKQNFLSPRISKVLPTSFLQTENFSVSHDKFTWGVVRSNTGTFKFPCSSYREIYSRNSRQFLLYLRTCTGLSLVRHIMDHMHCADRNNALIPLTYTTVPAVYFHSQCLCVAFNGHECGVKAPSGVDPRHYCLSVLLKDFQKQVSHRPAVTYLDYALQTRVSVCQFSNLLSVTFNSICQDTANKYNFYSILSVQCFFKDLVNKDLNCTRTLPVNRLNLTELCLEKFFTQLVVCDDDAGDEVRVPYYAVGDSLLVRVLTCVDVVVRVLTLVTYLACPQLRNPLGKLLIAYLTTALLKLVLVRATAEDLPLAVRLDVSLDLACTLCLTAYNHFLTSSFKTLRPPGSLTRAEVRHVLLRSALLGWVFPLVLSAVFFGMDEAFDSPVLIGQLLFVLSNYAALLYNLYLFHGTYKCYRYIRSYVERDEKTRGVYTDLFVFALKTSLLSGAGIIFRLFFTQIQGLEQVLGYYHALGTLQGLLLFLLYGCSREARVFWLGVGSSTLRLFQRRHNSSLRSDSIQMVPMPAVYGHRGHI